MSKIIIRKKLFNKRKLNFNEKQNINFLKILKILLNKNIKKGIIGGYFPVNYEIDDLDILREFEKKKYKISLPVIQKNNQMYFYSWSFKKYLQINKYGIPEPDKNKIVYPDVLLVPMVAFDHKRYRLGYGGGYYDRYISMITSKKNFISIGLAFDFQKVKRLPVNKFDKKVDVVVTNKKIYK